MRFLRFLVLFLAIVTLCSSGTNASGFEISGIGTKAMGMGGAFRAIADDWTAAYYNPAGYAKIFDSQYGASNGFLHDRFEVTPNYLWGGQYESGIYNDQINYNNHEILSNPSGGFVTRLPYFGEIGAGVSAFQLFDENNTWNLYDFPLAYNSQLSLPNDQYSINLDVVAFQLTLAKEFMNDKLSLGIGLQLLRADLVYSNIYFRDNPYEAINFRPFEKITQWNKNDGNGYGFGVNLGMLYNVTEKFNIGLNARVPFAITLSGNSSLEYYMPLIQNIDSIQPGTPGHLFVAGNKIVDKADFETELKLPTSFGIGLAYQLTEKLLVSVDAEYTMWSNYEGFNFLYTNHSGLNGAADSSQFVNDFLTANVSDLVEWENTGKVALGLEYDFNDNFTLLGGGSVDQSPSRENSLLTPQFIDTGDKQTFSGGLIWHYRQYDLGFVTSYTSYPDLNSGDLVDANADGLFDNFNGFYKAESYETVFSFIYRF